MRASNQWKKRLTKIHLLDPQLVWRLHEFYFTLSTTSSNICAGLSQELAEMKIQDFDHPTKGLNRFDSNLAKFKKISKGNPMPDPLAIMYPKSASHGNKELPSAWTQCKTMMETMKPGTTSTYNEYYEYMLRYAKKLEAALTDNTTSWKTNTAESVYLQPCTPSDACYNDATDLSSYMIDWGEDVDMIHDVL